MASNVQLKSFVTNGDPQLSNDPDGNLPTGVAQPNSGVVKGGASLTRPPDGYSCTATTTPFLFQRSSAARCGTPQKDICFMRGNCTHYKDGVEIEKIVDTELACESSGNGTCPDPSACAEDPNVIMREGKIGYGIRGRTVQTKDSSATGGQK